MMIQIQRRNQDGKQHSSQERAIPMGINEKDDASFELVFSDERM
jgi:hypothetical protein